ncbi:hypothetical protein AA0X95_20650 [Bacillus sp. 1P10SD]
MQVNHLDCYFIRLGRWNGMYSNSDVIVYDHLVNREKVKWFEKIIVK